MTFPTQAHPATAAVQPQITIPTVTLPASEAGDFGNCK